MSAERFRVGPGEVSIEGSYPTRIRYREGERAFYATWDPRETGTQVAVQTACWHEPPVAMTEEERERVYEGLWRMAKQAGATALMEGAFTQLVPVRWRRARGFLVSIQGGGSLEYMLLGRLLVLPFTPERAVGGPIEVAVTEPLHWTQPAGVPLTPTERAQLLERLPRLTDDDLWIGAGYGWRVRLASPSVTS